MNFPEFARAVDARAREAMPPASELRFECFDSVVSMGIRAKVATWRLDGAVVKFVAMSTSGAFAEFEGSKTRPAPASLPEPFVPIREASIDHAASWVRLLEAPAS